MTPSGCSNVEAWIASFLAIVVAWGWFVARRRTEAAILEDRTYGLEFRKKTEATEAKIRKEATDAKSGTGVEVLDRAARDLGFVVGRGGGKPPAD